jgi:hypothetical protein
VKLFQEFGVSICQTPQGLKPNGVYCGGWLGDKITYASTHYLGIDSAGWVYDSSPGAWGFWPEMLLPNHQSPGKVLPKQDKFGGFWWQIAVQLPGDRDAFVKGHYYKIAEAVRSFLIPFMGGYKKSWGLAAGKLPQHDCSFPDYCTCAQSSTYPKHPAEKKRCDNGIKKACQSGGLNNPVCSIASSQTALYKSSSLKRDWLQKGLLYGCSLGACPWFSKQTATAGCPSFSSEAPDQCLARTQKAGVRCCAPKANWVPKAKTSTARPYGCLGTATYGDAVKICASYGFRLCKKSELAATCWKTQCNWMDKKPVWVSDTCASR